MKIFMGQINTPIGWLLIGAGIMAAAIGKPTDASVVFGAVLINAIIGFIQEYRAGRAIEALSALVPETSTVIRGSRSRSVPSEELVPGDIVTLQSGDRIPADLRLFRVKNLQADESALTGESLPVIKNTTAAEHAAPLGDRFGMAYSGTMVVQGTAAGVVAATGAGTELGRINALLSQAKKPETPLTRQLARVSLWITVAIVITVAVLIAFGIFVKGAPVGESLLVAVSLAAAAIPEGLPAVITIALSIGVRRMADRHAVVRHLPAVETLGSTTVICSDKTGTLTRNEMTVQAAWLEGVEYRLSGIGYAPDGEIEHDGRVVSAPDHLNDLLTVAVLCNDASLAESGGAWFISGDPTEAALVTAARKAGLDEHSIRSAHERLDVIPFESDTKYMATLNRFDDTGRIMLKGAPEQVLVRCNLESGAARSVTEAMETYARQGMRVIAFAWKPHGRREDISTDDMLDGMTFAGLLGMIDPPRTEAMEAIRVCHAAGITVKMITGDHPVTAAAIGRQLGLLGPVGTVVEGHELDRLGEEELRRVVSAAHVFARVAPEHKIRLVKALQSRGEVVAMTGDGVNDAPALRQADIGIAMGITGTAVSREASKVVLVDDNFASIAAAVEEGRRVYDNLVKSLAFILPVNLGLACTQSAAMFFFPTVDVAGSRELLLAMSPSQTLWINLVASITLSVPLAFEVLEPGAMARPPRPAAEPVFSGFIITRLVMVALIMALAACGLFLYEYHRAAGGGPISADLHLRALAGAQTTCVTVITFTQIFYLLNCRSLKSTFFRQGVFSNPSVFIGSAVLLLLQLCFCYLPPLQRLFGSAPLDGGAWLRAGLAGAVVLPLTSLEKAFRRRAK